MILRLVTIALCVTCVVFLGSFAARLSAIPRSRPCAMPPGAPPPVRVIGVDARHRLPCPQPSPAPTTPGSSPWVVVVDVARGVAPSEIAALLHLRPDEHIAAVDDCLVDSDLAAGARIAALAPWRGSFLDLSVSSPRGGRRMLVLVH